MQVFQNDHVAFSFDSVDGSYSIRARGTERIFVDRSTWSVLDWCSASAEGYAVSSGRFADAIGSGVQADIRATMPDAELLLQLRLYDAYSGVALRCGLVNRSGDARQITRMEVLHAAGENACVRLGDDPAQGHRMLTGEGGFSYAHLIDGIKGRTLNVMTWLYARKPVSAVLLMGALTTYEFQTEVISGEDSACPGGFSVTARMFDATGKRVDDGCSFWGDWLWVDGGQDDPYEAQRNYAQCMARAMNVSLNNYNDYISVCLWYVFAFSCGDRSANTSSGAVAEAEAMIRSGITRYAPAMVRLVPDEYVNPNEQLWWDEAHWQRYVHLTQPYETLQKWITRMTELGCIGGLYMQPTFRSDDYCAAHPGHMLFDRADNEADYTDPDFVRHMRQVYQRIREAGVRSMFYDYTMLVRGDIRLDENALLRPGGFADPYATNVSAYRSMFRIAKETAGRQLMITENTWNYSGQELATGLIDAQRSKMDNVGMNREVVKSGVRQWYRNKVTKLIDPDVKNFTTTDRDIRRKEISLMGLLFGKTMLGSSITRYDGDAIRDIGRILPMPMDGQTAVPLDLFLSDENGNASLFDYRLPGDVHILALLNETHHQRTFRVALGEKPVFGGVGLDAGTTYDLWDFWNESYIGRMRGDAVLEQTLRKNECRVIAVRPVQESLHVLSTNRHILQGMVETECIQATEKQIVLKCRIIGGDPMKVVIALPRQSMHIIGAQTLTPGVACEAEKDAFSPTTTLLLSCTENTEALVMLTVADCPADTPEPPVPCAALIATPDALQGCVRLTWRTMPLTRYRLFKDGVLLCVTRDGIYADFSAEEHTVITYTVAAENTAHVLSAPVSCTVDTGSYLPSLAHGLGGACDRFGKAGYVLYNMGQEGTDSTVLPGYVSAVSVEDRRDYCFTCKGEDRRALTDPVTGTRALGMLCDDKALRIDIDFRDDALHTVTLYSVDCNRAGRTMDIEVHDAQGRILVPCRNIPEFGEGVHITFICRGTARICLTNHAVNAVVSAIYFD